MNVHDENDGNDGGRARELVPDAWRELDDSLADGPAPASLPAEAKPWLADQRVVHGLLRALHTQDATAREARVAAILARIDAEPRRDSWRRWLGVAAAALLLACAGLWFALPARLPTAEAAVQRAVHELARDVARRFQLVLTRSDKSGREVAKQQAALVTRPGGKFRVSGRLGIGQLQFGELTIGSDGTLIWGIGANGMWRHSVPAAEREGLQRRFGDVLDLGYLDVQELVSRLPADFELVVVGRERDATNRAMLRIECVRKAGVARMKLTKAWLLCDEATGMVTRIEAEFPAGGGVGRVSIEYLGEEPPGLVDFQRPW